MCTMRLDSEGARRRRAPVLAQLVDLFLIEMTNWRWCWRSMVITASLAPLVSIAALGIFARDSGIHALGYVLTGNMVISLMFGNMDNVQSHFSFIRFRGALDYFATLPIRRQALVLAVVLGFLLLSLPSLVVTLVLGSAILRVPIAPHPIAIVVIPMCAIPLSGIGALIGSGARTPQESGSWALIVTMVMAGLGPVVVPPERLPRLLLLLGRFSPATYAASALRQALLGPVTGQIAVDLAVLAGVTAIVFALVGRVMDWRQR